MPNKLPVELLGDIFGRLPNLRHPHPLSLAVVSHVCRYWREVTLNTSSLWTHIPFTHGSTWAMEALNRSKPSPIHLDIKIGFLNNASYKKAVCTVLAQQPNLKTLRVDDADHPGIDNFGFETRSEIIQALAARAQPSLESLELLGREYSNEAWEYLLEKMTSHHLRNLTTSNCPFPPDSPILFLSSLSHLEITDSFDAWSTIDSLLDALSALSSLKSLSLTTEYASLIRYPYVTPRRGRHLVHLPQLEFFCLEDTFSVTEAILQALSLPTTTEIVIGPHTEDDEECPSDASKLGGALLSHFTEAVVADAAFQSVSVDIYYSPMTISISLTASQPRNPFSSSTNDTSLPDRTSFAICCDRERSGLAASMFNYITELPVLQNVRSVEIRTQYDQNDLFVLDAPTTVVFWQPLFAAFARLSPELHIDGPCAHAVVSAMHSPSFRPHFASLHSLHIAHVDFAARSIAGLAFFAALLAGMERKSIDGNPLSCLVIKDCVVNVVAEVVEDLRRYLGHRDAVRWDQDGTGTGIVNS
ncbi:hypothetical protein OF83DRAFT_1175047 [Amylostereum chailletii]|nr:hypothetical protein OF83DRAFT_1175047 [Amylostereum chailletii]